MKSNRLGIAFFFDERGIVDDYMIELIKSLIPFCDRTILVSNGELNEESRIKLSNLEIEVIIRSNEGFDVWGYKAAIEYVGYDKLSAYNELILYNHTFYGPIFPWIEMFDSMEATSCDFWGISTHRELVPNPFTDDGKLPKHINSHFIAVRKKMLSSSHFRDYWESMPPILSYTDSILKHETKFTAHFSDLGYDYTAYIKEEDYGSHYPLFIDVAETVERRCPILKRRPFFHEHLFHDEYAIDLPRALKILEQKSDYDVSLIWRNIVKSSKLRMLNANAVNLEIIPSVASANSDFRNFKGKIAVCAHVYYDDMIHELLEYSGNIPIGYDFIATTSSHEKKSYIERVLAETRGIENYVVRVVGQNRGRDMSSLFIDCREYFSDDKYDVVCRLHTKKSPQVEASRGLMFKRFMVENLLETRGYVENLLNIFANRPYVGIALPPVIHNGYPTLGHSWFTNRAKVEEICKLLDITVPLDDSTPVAAYGTMFWFRPKALTKLFQHEWKYEDFNQEPHHIDGGLAHALERTICYAAQDSGYIPLQVMNTTQAAHKYATLEYKAQLLSSYIPGDIRWQVGLLRDWAKAGYPTARDESDKRPIGDAGSEILQTDKQPSSNETLKMIFDTNIDSGVEIEILRNHYTQNIFRKFTGLRGKINSFKANVLNSSNIYSRIFKEKMAIYNYIVQVIGRPTSADKESELKQKIVNYILFGQPEPFVYFQSGHYKSQISEANPMEATPLFDYLKKGYSLRLSPHPLFDIDYYGRQLPPNLDIPDLLTHYVHRGWRSNINPHPLFDVSYYLGQYKDVAKANIDPLRHYLEYGAYEGRDPHPHFSSSYYLRMNSDVRISKSNPLVHFVTVGYKQKRNPNPNFDLEHYRFTLGHNLSDAENPLLHWIKVDKEYSGPGKN